MFFTKAPVVFAVVEKQRISTILTILEKNGMTKAELDNYDTRSSILSMGAAIENMSLTAHALGLQRAGCVHLLLLTKNSARYSGLGSLIKLSLF